MAQDTADPTPNDQGDIANLSADLREHLGRKLRSELRLTSEQPAFLGDDALPPKFAELVRQIEDREELPAREGLHAIRKEFGLPEDER